MLNELRPIEPRPKRTALIISLWVIGLSATLLIVMGFLVAENGVSAY